MSAVDEVSTENYIVWDQIEWQPKMYDTVN